MKQPVMKRLAFFPQVAKVLGERKASVELAKVWRHKDNMQFGEAFEIGKRLDETFVWHESPQGHKFWANIDYQSKR